MPKIVVSYRRSDSSAQAGRIYDHLLGQFGEDTVFMDVDAIPFGTDFRKHINEELVLSDILLAVIGPDWLGRGAAGGGASTTRPIRSGSRSRRCCGAASRSSPC